MNRVRYVILWPKKEILTKESANNQTAIYEMSKQTNCKRMKQSSNAVKEPNAVSNGG